MAKERRDWADRAVYVFARLLTVAVHSFPVESNLAFARLVGRLIYRFDRKHRERALDNLRRAYPELAEPQREDLARRSLEQIAMFAVDLLFTTRLVRIDTWADFIELHNFREVVAELLRRERGLVMLTGHYGNFEILGYLLATFGFPTASVARPLDNPYISRWIFGVREKMGQRMIIKKGATEDVTAELEANGAVGFVADQNAGSKAIFVDFFGRKAATYKSIGLVAMHYDVPIVVGYARRIGNAFRFRVGVQDIIWPDDWKPQDDPLRYITQRYTRAIETFVREEPAQYWWVHRRWKTRPKGEKPTPDRPPQN